MDQFILFGDSIIQQSFSPHTAFPFGAALADLYARKLDVVNRGLSGYCTTQAYRTIPLCIPNPSSTGTRVRFLLIAFGANDARLPVSVTGGAGPDQHVSLQKFSQNLRRMVEHPGVRAHEGVRVILATPPPVDERKGLAADAERFPGTMGRVVRRKAGVTAAYAQAVRLVGEEMGVPVLDIHRAMLVRCGHDPTAANQPVADAAPDPELPDADARHDVPIPGSLDAPVSLTLQGFLSDGLHFTGAAYELLYGELMGLIAREWPEQMPDRLPMRLPAWDAQAAWMKGKDGRHAWEEEEGMAVEGRFRAVVEGVGGGEGRR